MVAAGSLARRFARLGDLTAIWRPRRPSVDTHTAARTGAASGPSPGVFSGVQTRQSRERAPAGPVQAGAPPQVVTWAKFERTALPHAERVECLIPGGSTNPFVALVTAVDPAAPPILEWDHVAARNPVSWYFYSGGSSAARWNLSRDRYVDVTAVTRSPAHWLSPSPNQADMAVLVLDGCRDAEYDRGTSLFPETLRPEFHAVRKTIEAHSAASMLSGRDEATACGIAVQQGDRRGRQSIVLRVTSRGAQVLYAVDRWD